MTFPEWAEFAGRIEATFRGGLVEDREHELRRHFDRVPFALAERALADLVAHEQVFVPTPGEMHAALRRITGGGWPLRCALAGMTSEQMHAHLEGPAVRLLERGDDGADGARAA